MRQETTSKWLSQCPLTLLDDMILGDGTILGLSEATQF